MTHEVVAACAAIGLELREKMRDMLNEEAQHATERRGCGLTQATRLLATHVNCQRATLDVNDLALFADVSRRAAAIVADRAQAAGWTLGWRELHRAPPEVVAALSGLRGADALIALDDRLATVAAALEFEESKLLLGLVRGVLAAGSEALPSLPFMAAKPDIGSCSRAEEFFLEIAHDRVRRRGYVNIFVDANKRPVMVEKMHMGESHSAIFLEAINIGGVVIPPGGLAALRHVAADTPPPGAAKTRVLGIDRVAEARFLRLTTLAVSPANRERAFSTQYKRQIVLNMLAPESTTMDDLRRFARNRLQQA